MTDEFIYSHCEICKVAYLKNDLPEAVLMCAACDEECEKIDCCPIIMEVN